ncbi:MAG TPA: MFS transporter [Gryllotalpicola sp.]
MSSRSTSTAASVTAPVAAGAPRWKSALILVVCCTAIFMTTLDGTILNVALPSMGAQLHASSVEQEWAVNSYIITRAGLLLVAAAIGDRFGRKRAFAIGMIVFTLGSLGCALSLSAGMLIGFRVVEAVGGTFMTPASMALLAGVFTDPGKRAQAFGWWSAATGVSTTAGPLIGGALVQAFGWQSVFYVNIPVGILGLLGLRLLTESRAAIPPRINVVPQVLIALVIVGLVYGLMISPEAGWGNPKVYISLVVAALAAVTFLLWEWRSTNRLFTTKPGMGVNLASISFIAIACYIGINGFTFYNSLYLQEVRGFMPLLAGLLITPVMVASIVLSPIAGWLTGRFGAKWVTAVSCALIAIPIGILAMMLRPGTPIWALVLCYGLLGIGYGVLNAPLSTATVASMDDKSSGVAAATTSTSRQIGTSTGIALVGIFVYTSFPAGQQSPAGGVYPPQLGALFTSGVATGWAVTALISLTAVVVAVVGLKGRGKKVEEQDRLAVPLVEE